MAAITAEKLAQAINVTPRRVRQLVEEGLPREAPGQYDLGRCMAWYIRYLQERLRHKEPEEEDAASRTLRAERQRLIRAQADREELELKRARGEVIPVALFEERMAALITAARQRMMGLPGRLAPALEGEPRATIKARLAAGIADALSMLVGQHDDSNISRGTRGEAALGPAPINRGARGARSRRKAAGSPLGTAAQAQD